MVGRIWMSFLAVALAAGTGGCAGGFAGGSCGAAARLPLAPAGTYVDDDVADGYAAYAGALASAGRWESDATYGVHWCPARGEGAGASDEPFRPYLSHGHWTASDQAAYGAPAGTPYWTTDDSARWTDVTTHHGWWIDLHRGATGRSEWCWVPGAQETPARVVWRTGDDFVGWAPEPPAWVDDGDESADAGFEWTFELLGTLLEDATDAASTYALGGDAVQTAAADTAPSRVGGPAGRFSRRAPARPVVDAAREQLVARLGARADEARQAATASSHSTSGNSGGTSSGTSSGSTRRPDSDDDGKPVVVVVRLPPGDVLLPMVMGVPAVGVGGASYGSSASGSARGGGGWGAHGSSAWTAPHASTSAPSLSTSSHSASSGSSSHGGSSSSGSSRSSSSTSSSSHHHKR
jgi:hypothetical protein